MHYFVVAFVPLEAKDVQAKIDELLAPLQDNKWDWYRVGGRYNGIMRNKSRDSEEDGGFNFNDEFETLEENSVPVKELDHKVDCFAYVTQEGKWADRYIAENWWELNLPVGQVYKPDDVWEAEVFKAIREHQECLAVGLDVHN